MPRKTCGMPFEVHPSPHKNSEGKNVLYARPLSGQKLTLKQVDDYCASHSYLRQGELTRTFPSFIDAMGHWLAQGYRIETPLGTFEPKVKLRRELTDPELVKHDDAVFDGIDYHSSADFERQVSKWIDRGYRYVQTPQSAALKDDEPGLAMALRQSIDRNKGYTTVADYARASGLTKYSARQQLNKWCQGQNPKLMRSWLGRTMVYTEI